MLYSTHISLRYKMARGVQLFFTLLPAVLTLAAGATDPCKGQAMSCTSETTIQVCARIRDKFVPVDTVKCPASYPYCRAGVCQETPGAADPDPEPDACNGMMRSCTDCNTLLLCAAIGSHMVPAGNVTCPDSQPYCVQGECSSTPTEACAPSEVASAFQCTGNGYFPDPADCTRFHFCVGSKAFDLDCTSDYPGLVYDHEKAMCVPASRAPCFAFDCRRSVGRYLHYGPDNTVYAYCVSERNEQALVARCPPNQRIDVRGDGNPKCEVFCAKEGRLPHPQDATRYYECTALGGMALGGPAERTCPEGSVFNSRLERCVVTGSGQPSGEPGRPTPTSTSAPITTPSTPPTPPRRTLNPFPW